MTTIDEAIDAIYDAKAGKFRDLGGEPVTPDNLPRGPCLVWHEDNGLSIMSHIPGDYHKHRILRRAEHRGAR